MSRTMHGYLLLLALPLLLGTAACERLLWEDDLGTTDPQANFDHLWREVDGLYSYFELKQINWDEVRAQYEPLVDAGMGEEALFEVLADMLNELRDDHVNLVSPFNISRYNVALQHPANFRWRTVEEHYVPNVRTTGGFQHDFIDSGRVGYIRYESFSRSVRLADLNHILLRYRNTRGLVLDLRENGGGELRNVGAILEHFTAGRVLAAYSITRNGPGHNDFSSPRGFYLNPAEGVRYLKPVVVLTDRGSYSATTFFALAAKSLPNVILLGDTTGGGGGLPNGGQLPNGWRYRFSITQLLDLDGLAYAEDGVPPAVTAAFNWSDLTKDEVIERALELLPE